MDTTTYLTVTRPPIVTAQVCGDSTEVVVGLRDGVMARSVCFQFDDPSAGHALAIAITNAVHDAEKLRLALDEQDYADELLDVIDDQHQADLEEIEAF